MHAGERKRLRDWILQAGLVVVAFALLAWTVRGNWSQIQGVIARRPDPRLFAAALAVHLLALCLSFVRWFLLVRALRLPFRLRDALRLGFIGNIFNLVIPGAVGGDLVKAGFLIREQARKAQAVGSMVVDRVVGMLGLFLLAAVAGLAELPAARPPVRSLVLFAWCAFAAGGLALCVLLTQALYRPLLKWADRRPKLAHAASELVQFISGYRERLGALVCALGMAIVGHLLNVLVFLLIDQALFGPAAPSLSRHLVIVPLVLFTTAVPLPFGALGLSEKASESLFDLVGFEGGAVAMMGYRAVMYAGAIVSALVYAANARQVRALRADSAPAAPD